jgi:hypothetical protein
MTPERTHQRHRLRRVATKEPSRLVHFEQTSGKLRSGVFLKGVSFYTDRVVFEVFASRLLDAAELATMQLADDLGTAYEALPVEGGIVEGHARIEFAPAAPPDWATLHLSQAGWGLHILKDVDRASARES